MNSHLAPNLIEHPRSAREISGVLERLLNDAGFAPLGTDPLLTALVQAAARYGEIVTQCVNATANLHLDAFSELLGGQARHAAAARVHVSFKPVAGGAVQPIKVPLHTPLAIQGDGDPEPAVFETLAELQAVCTEPVRAVFANAGHRRVADVGLLLSDAGFAGDLHTLLDAARYALHIGQHTAFGLAGLQQVSVQLDVQSAGSGDSVPQFEWSVPTPKGDLPLEVVHDTTAGLRRSGEVTLVPPSTWPVASIDGVESLWLTLRLRHSLDAAASATPWRSPRLAAIAIRAVAATGPQPVTAACYESMPLDISKDVFPFGERPRFGAVFQVLCPAFGEPGAKIEMLVRLTNPVLATASPIPPVTREGQPSVVWEIATTSGFQAVAANDGTQSLTQDGSVVFTVPNDVAVLGIAGKIGSWLRARLASGHYGSTVATDGTAIPLMRAPAIRSLAVRSTLERGPLQPEHLVSQSPLTSNPIDPRMALPVDVFPSPDVDGPALYIGLDALAGAATRADALATTGVLARGSVINWHVRPTPPTPPVALGDMTQGPIGPRWQMHTADGWCDTTVHDGSADLTRSGVVRLALPDEPAHWPGSTPGPTLNKLMWLRIVWPTPSPALPQLPVRLAINSVAAQHSQWLRNEIVGSSNGQAGQAFKTLRTPIIGSVLLQVREAEDAWVAWNEVDTLAVSRPDSRDFTLDRSTGDLCFGDGRFGRIPPPGANNVRLREYTTGGGGIGNKPAKATVQMRSAVRAVESVINLEPATGGLDVEDAASVRGHASAWLRHRDRAVCADDFADLALRASPDVARAFCVAGRDLGVAASAEMRQLETQPGVVSTMIIPRSTDPAPQPSLVLLAEVKDYLDARRLPVGRLVIVGPTYTRVSVKLQVTPMDGWSPDAVAGECTRRISEFLHPLTGGLDGNGWALGRRPHRSDVLGLVDGIDGVDFVRGLSLVIDAPMGMPIIVAAGAVVVESRERP